MRVGIVVGFQNPDAWHRPWPEVYRSTLAFVEHAENVGLDEVWLTEHHFVEDGYCPALLPVAAAIAARTRHIRIGTKLLLAPFHDPVRIAEDAAVVDILSNGRLDLGLGAGYRAEEFQGFGIPVAERAGRLEEAVSVIRSALSGGSIAHEGRYYRYGDARIMPRPVQDPIPLWLGGRSAAAIRRTARLGCHLQLADFRLEAAREDSLRFVEALRSSGRDPAEARIAAVATVFVDRTRDRAMRVAGPHLVYQQNQYERWFAAAADRVSDRGHQATRLADLDLGVHLVGTPAEVTDRILAVREEVPFTDFSFWMLLPGLSADVAVRSLQSFAAEVLPALHALDGSTFETPRGGMS